MSLFFFNNYCSSDVCLFLYNHFLKGKLVMAYKSFPYNAIVIYDGLKRADKMDLKRQNNGVSGSKKGKTQLRVLSSKFRFIQ